MLKTARELRGAGGIGAAVCRALNAAGLVAHDGLAARRASLGHHKRALAAVAFIWQRLDYLGNYISRLANGNGVSDHYAALAYEIQVVQSCTAYRRSRKTDGLKHRRRSQHTGASDRHGDVCKLCEFGLGREFVSHSPLRRFRPLAEITPQRDQAL